MSNTRTIIFDPADPDNQTEVELAFDEVLAACNRMINDKKFQQSLDMYYNEDHVSSWDYWSPGDFK